MTETGRKYTSINVWVAIVIFVLRCCIGWCEVKAAVDGNEIAKCAYILFGYVGEAIGIAAIFMFCLNKWWWKYKPFAWLHHVPILAKEYNGRIRFKNIEGHEEECDTTIYIDQTFLNVTVKLGTCESKSNSIMATITTINDSQMLIYTYQNIPNAELQDRSAIHYGTAMLYLDDPKHITGNYFTTRKSRGSMDLKAVDKQ